MNKKDWYLNHTNCPQCGKGNVVKTNKEVICGNDLEYSDDVNTASCPDCGWKGMVKNLVIDPELKKSVKEITSQIRTFDKVNENGQEDVYVSAEDLVATIRTWGSQLTLALKDEDVIAYTQNILAEIIKIIISTDISHRVQKSKKMNEDGEINKEENKEE